MSGNSTSSALHSAPIVIDFAGGSSSSSGAATASICTSSSCRVMPELSAGDVRELELADLQLVGVLEPVRLDPVAVDVGAVERPEVVEVEVAAAAHEQGVVARDRHVVEEDVGVRPAADRQPVAVEREALADAPAARADDEYGAVLRGVVEVDRDELAGLADAVGRGRRVAPGVVLLRRRAAEEVAAALAVVGAVRIDEAAVGAVQRHGAAASLARGRRLVASRAPREDVGEAPDVVAGDHVLAALVLLAQAVDELRAEDVDLAVEDPPLVRDVDLLLGELLDEVLQLLVGERAEVGERVHEGSYLLGTGSRQSSAPPATVNLSLRVAGRPTDHRAPSPRATAQARCRAGSPREPAGRRGRRRSPT